MPEDTKSPTPPRSGDTKTEAGESIPGSTQSSPEKVATAPRAAEHAAPTKPTGPTPVPWDSPLVFRLKAQHGSGLRETVTYLGQKYIVADSSLIPEMLRVLRDQEQFDYCVDVTAVHYPDREKQFEVVWILYSFPHNDRIRVKASYADGEAVPSVVDIWPAANWLEREVYDMFGLRVEGHPDLKRILLPDGWKGHPLRKDYGIIQQDQEWVQINLGIESGQ
jgi:NADH-quinone oxidoreductase subunit C